ncbi:hypothetical protein [Stenotrophomonas sp.]|uniref:hypothetical protein n=1 Tax=Stenotrophomonas sp. TaxID=69392 RepID=UPI00289F078F|nr:hypothetical protein [Stenotrophomonas sp.]
MDPRKLFLDERLTNLCAYCGCRSETRDHVPSKVLLDKPYPDDLPVVPCCLACNVGVSAAEQYFACLVECVKHGSAFPDDRFRATVSATLTSRPGLSERIARSRNREGHFEPEQEAVTQVLLKLGRGHITSELGLLHCEEPTAFSFFPLHLMSDDALHWFSTIESSGLYPEIGSRAFLALSSRITSGFEQWNVVQDGLYMYAVGQGAGDWVRLVVGDYLGCYIAWE